MWKEGFRHLHKKFPTKIGIFFIDATKTRTPCDHDAVVQVLEALYSADKKLYRKDKETALQLNLKLCLRANKVSAAQVARLKRSKAFQEALARLDMEPSTRKRPRWNSTEIEIALGLLQRGEGSFRDRLSSRQTLNALAGSLRHRSGQAIATKLMLLWDQGLIRREGEQFICTSARTGSELGPREVRARNMHRTRQLWNQPELLRSLYDAEAEYGGENLEAISDAIQVETRAILTHAQISSGLRSQRYQLFKRRMEARNGF